MQLKNINDGHMVRGCCRVDSQEIIIYNNLLFFIQVLFSAALNQLSGVAHKELPSKVANSVPW